MKTVSLAALLVAVTVSSFAFAAPPAAEVPHVTPHPAVVAPPAAHVQAARPMVSDHATRPMSFGGVSYGKDTSFHPQEAQPLPRTMKIDMPPRVSPMGEGYVKAEGIARTPTVVGYQNTGVGNHFSVSTTVSDPFAKQGSTSTERPVAATVRYTDSSNYFAGADKVEAVAVLHVRTMVPGGKDQAPVAVGEASERTVHVILTKEDGRYVGTFQTTATGTAGKSEEQIDTMDLAFVSNGKWDSNMGKNYKD